MPRSFHYELTGYQQFQDMIALCKIVNAYFSPPVIVEKIFPLLKYSQTGQNIDLPKDYKIYRMCQKLLSSLEKTQEVLEPSKKYALNNL